MKSKLNITIISPKDPEYEKFIENRGGPFNDTELIELFEDLNIAAVRNSNNEITGCFVFSKGKLKAFSAIHTPELFQNCALIYEIGAQNPSRMNSARKLVLGSIVDYLSSQKVAIISLAFPYHFSDMQPFIWEKFTVKPKYTYLLSLNKSEEELLGAMSPERRTNLKKAKKGGYEIRENQKDDFLKLLSFTFHKIKRPTYEKAARKVIQQYANSTNSILNVVYKNGEPIAGVFCLYRNEYANYLFGAFDPNLKNEGAGALAMWQCVLDCRKRGIHQFDFTGSMVPGIEKYFRGFGGEMQTYFLVNKISSWLRLTANLFGRKFG